MKLNNPLPQALPKECNKAAKICALELKSYIPLMRLTGDFFELKGRSFVDSGNNGLDGVCESLLLYICTAQREFNRTPRSSPSIFWRMLVDLLYSRFSKLDSCSLLGLGVDS